MNGNEIKEMSLKYNLQSWSKQKEKFVMNLE